MRARTWKRGLATTILLVCVIVLPGQASADHSVSTVAVSPISENAPNASFTVTLAEAAAEDVILNYVVADGSTVKGPNASGQLTIAAGATSGAATPAIAWDDSLDEEDATYSVSVTHGAGTPVNGTAALNDNDAAPTVSIGTAGNVTEGGIAGFPVTLSAASGRPVQVSYQTIPATSPDFTGTTTGSITIASGTTGTIPVQTTEDAIIEGDEGFTVALNPCNATCSLGSPTQGTATIKDNEAGPKLSVESTPVTEGDGTTVDLVFTVKLSAASGSVVRVTALTGDGSAVAPDDYQPKSQVLTFNPGELTKPFPVVVKGDLLDEAAETVSVSLLSPENAEIEVGQVAGTINDNDQKSLLSIGDASADEPTTGTGTMTFTVTLAPASARTVTIGYGTMDGTAAAGSDYTPTGGTLTFEPFQTSKDVTVPIIGDAINEDNETVLVNLVAPSGGLVADAQAQGTIIDKNAPPSLSISDPIASESGGATFEVELAGTTLRTVTVSFGTTDGTAREPGDYIARSGTLTFAPGQKSKTIEVTVVDDTTSEPVETFSVGLGNVVNATITKSRGTATIAASDQVTPTGAPNRPPTTTNTPNATPKVLLPRMVLAPRTVKVTTTGLARLILTCAKASPIACRGSITLQTTAKPIVKLGTKTFAVAKGKKQTLGLKLSPKARKMLLKRPTLKARVVVIVKTSAKSMRVVPGVITLKAAATPAKKKATTARRPNP